MSDIFLHSPKGPKQDQELAKLQGNLSATGLGGVCFGDSGGPAFLGGSATIAAITSGGNQACAGPSDAYRLDTVAARRFLGRFMLLP